MKLRCTAIPDVVVIEPEVHRDHRGFVAETWNADDFAELGLELHFVQDNLIRSAYGVLRGMHYQLEQPQGKLVRVARGRAFDVAIDLRRSSPHFGKWVGQELTSDSPSLMWIPPGFAHGFLSLEDGTEVFYKCTAARLPQDEYCIAWDDPELGIDWPRVDVAPILSERDRRATPFVQASTFP